MTVRLYSEIDVQGQVRYFSSKVEEMYFIKIKGRERARDGECRTTYHQLMMEGPMTEGNICS